MNIHITIPTSYNDLTDWQLKKITFAVFGDLRYRKLILYILIVLVMLRPSIKYIYKLVILLRNVPLKELKQYTDFVFDTTKLTRFPKKIKCRGHTFFGPADRLSNLSIAEYSLADLWYYQWTDKQDIDALNRLVTTLYRPMGDINNPIDVREPFVKQKLEKHSQYIEKIKEPIKLAIAMAYGGSRVLIEERYKHIFPKRKNKKGRTKSYTTFDKVIQNMARSENQPFGDFYKTEKAFVNDFLAVMDAEIEHQKELEKKLNS